jgi:hypothetical protein
LFVLAWISDAAGASVKAARLAAEVRQKY